MRVRNHFLNIAEVQARGQMIALRVRIEELLVGLDNPHELNIRAIQNAPGWRERAALQKALDVTVNHTNNAHSHWGSGSGVNRGIGGNSKQGEHHKDQFHNASIPLK
jgi:hypothetical protein